MEDKSIKLTKNKMSWFRWNLAGWFLVLELIGNFALKEKFIENILLYSLIILGIAIVAAIVMAVIAKEEYITVNEESFTITKGKKENKYNYSEYAGTNVTRHYVRGIYCGTTRDISYKNSKGNKVNICCRALNKEKFSELASILSKHQLVEEHSESIPENYFESEKFFTIPVEQIQKANKNSALITNVITVIFLVAAIVLLIMGLSTSTVVYYGIASVCLLCTILMFFMFGLSANICASKVKTVPDHISFDNLTLAVGTITLSSEKISQIAITPASYRKTRRDIIITTTDNNKYRYCLGRVDDGDDKTNKKTYDKYDELFLTFRIWCYLKNISFLSILG